MEEHQRCQNCRYSKTYKVIDPIAPEILVKYKHEFSFPETTITKCYFQGAPQKVNPREDWCYQWKSKE